MPKVRASSGMIGHDRAGRARVADQVAQQLARRPWWSTTAWSPEPAVNSRVRPASPGSSQRLRMRPRGAAAGRRAPRRRSSRYWISGGVAGPGGSTGASLSWSSGMGSSSRSRKTRSSASDELLRLVGDVARLDAGAERPALDRLGQDRPSARPWCSSRGVVRRVDLAVVVAAAAQARSGRRRLRCGDQRLQARVGPEEVLADVGAADSTEYFWNSPSSVSFMRCRRARRRRRGPAGRPTRGPR